MNRGPNKEPMNGVLHSWIGRMGWLVVVVSFTPERSTAQLDSTATDDAPALLRGPAPAWVAEQPLPAAGKPPPAGTPAEIVLSDAQSRLTADGGDYYFHSVTRLLNSEGVRQNAEQTVVYAPDYQKVTWHTLRQTRAGQAIDLLPQTVFRRLQREPRLEAKIYDGRITAHTVLEDIRPGDELETAYTLHDTNPLMRGHQSSRHYLGSAYPVRKQVVTVRMPAELPAPMWYFWLPPDTLGLPEELFRPARLRQPLREEKTAEERIYHWESDALPGIVFDASISGQAAPYYPVIRCSSFTSWGKVVEWAEPLFSTVGALPEDMRARAAVWKKELPAPADRLRAAVDWVQTHIRYFAMAMGNHNIRPRPLRETCATRFGDCKDKTVLLVALLRELGFDAWPALVNTHSQHVVRHGGPDQYAFNHAIVAYEFDGRLRWVDPTLQQPAGPTGDWALPPYRLGLILRSDEFNLTEISTPRPAEPDMEVRDRLTVNPESGDAELVTEVVLRALQADFYRQSLEAVSEAERAKNWFNFIALFYRRLQETAAPVAEDDRAGNRIIIRARYRIPGLLRTERGQTGFSVYAYAARSVLDQPQSRRRHWPYALQASRFVRHRIELEAPFDLPTDQRPQVITASGLEYRVEKSTVGRRFLAVHDLELHTDSVPAAEMDRFCEAVDEVLQDLVSGVLKPPTATADATGVNAPGLALQAP